MATTRETIRLAARLELVVNGTLSQSQLSMAAAWARAWRVVQNEWIAITTQIARDMANGEKPTRRTLARLRNIRSALVTTQELLDELVQLTSGMLVGGTQDIVTKSAAAQARLIASQLPQGSGIRTEVAARGELPNRQLEQITRRTQQQITSRLIPLSADATEAVMDQLLVGSARGQNPRAVARQMLQQVNGAFNGGYARALNVARTELLDAHRNGSAAGQGQFADVLSGWQWLAHLSTRTCPACWGMHGTIHRLDEPGPIGHQQCRCSRVPKTKSWRELGIDIDEPTSLIVPGNQAFAGLPAKDQLAIMGPTRLAALKSGTADWSELAQLKHNSGWRDAYYVRPVGDFRPRMNQTA